MHHAVAARERGVGLRRDERRAAHRLDATRDEEVSVPGDHGMAGADDGRKAGRAEAVHRDAPDRVRQAGEQRGEARHVAVVLARLVRAAEPDVLDLSRRNARPLDGGRHGQRREVVRADAREAAAVAAHRRPDRREDHGFGHGVTLSGLVAGESSRPAVSRLERQLLAV